MSCTFPHTMSRYMMISMLDQKSQKYLEIYESRKFESCSIFLTGDSEPINNRYFLDKLSSILEAGQAKEDYYSLGGVVKELEDYMANFLGKESAVFFPTGTMANHIAIRKLCGISKRAIVQEQSHIYQDSGDAVQNLSGINLIPLGNNAPFFTANQFQQAIKDSLSGRVVTKVGMVSIESPVRRCHGQQFPYDEMKEVSQICQSEGIGTHLDGARLLMMSEVSGIDVTKYTELFDTVYVSLWKYFGGPFGAILAGTEEFCQGLFHERRMFGGSLPSAGFAAALALNGIKNFQRDYKEALDRAQNLFRFVDSIEGIDILPYENGTNIFKVLIDENISAIDLKLDLAGSDIFVSTETLLEQDFDITINTTLLRQPISNIRSSLERFLS